MDTSLVDYTFPRDHRILTRAQYQRVFDDNRRSTDSFFAVLAARPDTSASRVGITVSKKVSKKAVERNRIKRIVRESFRHLDDGQPVADYVVIARVRCADSSNEEILASLSRHWERLSQKEDQQSGSRRRDRRPGRKQRPTGHG